jgi:hypothetical protein
MANVRRSRSRTFSNMCVGEVIGRRHSGGGVGDGGTPALSRTNTSTSSVSESEEEAAAGGAAGELSAEAAAEVAEDELAAAAMQAKVHTKYDLFAVTNHYGRSGYGHYTAMAR